MADQAADKAPTKPAGRGLYEVAGVFVGILGVAVAVIFGFRAEREKSLSLRYVSERALISLDDGAARQLEIAYQGRTVTRPYLLSARFENTGDLPVEDRDIERALTLEFKSAAVVGVKLGERHPFDLDVAVSSEAKSVVVRHKLLNPGDWLSFDVLLDGDPSQRAASIRVAGVRSLELLNPTSPSLEPRPAFFDFSKPTVISILAAAAIVPALIIFAGFAMLGEIGRDMLFGKKGVPFDAKRVDAVLTPSFKVSNDYVYDADLSEEARRIAQLIRVPLRISWVDNPEPLTTYVASEARGLEALGLTTDQAVQVLLADLRRLIPKIVGKAMYLRLPLHVDTAAQQRVLALPFADASVPDYIARVTASLEDLKTPPKPVRGIQAIDWTGVAIGALALVFGTASALVSAGAWRGIVAGP